MQYSPAASSITSQDVASSRMAPPPGECARPRIDHRPQSPLSLMHLLLLATPAKVPAGHLRSGRLCADRRRLRQPRSVAARLLGKSGRAMIDALIAGERDPARHVADMNPELVGVAGFEPAASSSRSQVAARATSAAARVACGRPSMRVRWRPPLLVAIVIRFVTRSPRVGIARSRRR
jgi:hypothetical protein